MNGPPSRADVALRRVRSLIVADVALTLTGVVVLAVTYLFVHTDGYVLLLGAMVAAAAAVMAAGLLPLRRGRADLAVGLLALANFSIAVGATAVATFAMPVLLVAAMLPAVFAVPHVSRRALRWYAAGTFGTTSAVAMLGLLQDVTQFTDGVPSWLPTAVVVAFTPLISLLVVSIALTNGSVLRDSLDEALAANEELAHAQAALRHNAEQLRDSRARVVAAADRERRRIERDLHDGAQQQLVGISLHLAMVRERVEALDPSVAAVLGEVQRELQGSIVQLRDLAHGIYPPALVQRGLPAALGNIVAQLPLSVHLDVSGAGRCPAEVENAVYFCCLEALQNAIKHGGEGCTIRLWVRDTPDGVEFGVADDGLGFDRDAQPSGAGFDNMLDRLATVGGQLQVRSAPGVGTTVHGCVPLPRPAAHSGLPSASR